MSAKKKDTFCDREIYQRDDKATLKKKTGDQQDSKSLWQRVNLRTLTFSCKGID